MELLLKNVSEAHLKLISELAKSLNFEISEALENEDFYLDKMEEGKGTRILDNKEKGEFLNWLKEK
ncbi:MAG: hypothetical protein H7Y07_05160 [Pyrinomonadaceae bacterium]|nr:hypothetical protein [Sphingobacteriaceae bacterium]